MNCMTNRRVRVLGIAVACLIIVVGILIVSRFKAASGTLAGLDFGGNSPWDEHRSEKSDEGLKPMPERTAPDINGSRWYARASAKGDGAAKAPPGDDRLSLADFVRRDWPEGIPYRLARRYAGSDEVLRLQEMLTDKEWELHWRNIAKVLGMASDDVNSVPVLLDYFRRCDTMNMTGNNLGAKIYSINYLGRFGGPLAKETLIAASTEDGAAGLAAEWIDSPLRVGDSSWGDKQSVIHYIRMYAIDGLVLLRDAEVNTMLRLQYEAVMDPAASDRVDKFLDGSFARAMAKIDLIEEVGVDGFLRLKDDRWQFEMRLMQYLQKYSPHDRELYEKLKQMKIIKRKRPGD